jgi:hypothetical protein
MAYSVDWIGKVITVPVADLTLVSGTRYQLDLVAFWIEIRRLEWDFGEGLWAPRILDHTDPKLDFAGADYAGFDEIINGYEVQFEAGPTRIDLLGSNNNILDVLIPTGIAVASFNSAGKQRVNTGSGLDAAQAEQLEKVHEAHYNRRAHDKTANTVTIYDTDKVTPKHVFDADDELTDISPQ